jgi:hypothetical protein
VLQEGVCEGCNNGLSHLDQALLHEFEILTFMRGIRRKGGKPPSINSWAPIAAVRDRNGPQMYLNGGPQTVEALGKKLPAAGPHNGIRNLIFKKNNGIAAVTFDIDFGRHPKFVRGLYKVAVGTVAYFHGVAIARKALYDPARQFVTTGKGIFRALMAAQSNGDGHAFQRPCAWDGGPFPLMEMTIFGANFLLDFDPEQRGIEQARAKATEKLLLLPPS